MGMEVCLCLSFNLHWSHPFVWNRYSTRDVRSSLASSKSTKTKQDYRKDLRLKNRLWKRHLYQASIQRFDSKTDSTAHLGAHRFYPLDLCRHHICSALQFLLSFSYRFPAKQRLEPWCWRTLVSTNHLIDLLKRF